RGRLRSTHGTYLVELFTPLRGRDPPGGASGLGTVFRARVAVEPLSAGMRVLTAVAVALMLDLPEDSDGPPLEIHVLPAQAERFTLPKAERESYGPAGSVPSVLCHGQDVPSLIGAQRLYLDFFHSGSVDQRADVPGGSDEDRMATSLLINTAQVLVIRSRATGRNIGTVI